MTQFLRDRLLLILFLVVALGCLLGRVRVRGFSLGVAAVLFAGLFMGWWLPGVTLPDFVAQLGLVLFVYTLGLSSGPAFFASLRLRGVRDNLLALGVLVASALLAAGLGRVLGLDGAALAGVFAGSLTNMPALTGVVEQLHANGVTGAALAAPVIACSICYPLGVLVPLLLAAACGTWFKRADAAESGPSGYGEAGDDPIVSVTARIDRASLTPAHALRKTETYSINFGRVRRGETTSVVHDDTLFEPGDLVTLIGSRANVTRAAHSLGKISDSHLEHDRSEVDFRRMFLSNPELSERRLRDLHLIEKYDAVVTRVRRGDVDLVPDGDFRLMMGDRARIVAPRSAMGSLERLFGDSARRVAEVDPITFGLGIALGLLVGAVPIPAPGGSFSLGLAGGPLLVGLVLGRLGRTGPLLWTSPYGANVTLRQFGLVLFLAGAGLQAGAVLGGSFDNSAALRMLVSGALISFVSGFATLFIGHRVLRIPLAVVVGMLAGVQTQPAVLAYAVEKTGRELPNVGYAAVFPIAMIGKILLAQLLLHAIGFAH